jgi:hypothetical protein
LPAAPEIRHLQLEIQRDHDSISGHISDEHGHTIRFSGWLELISALEKALTIIAATPDEGEPNRT